MSRNKRIRHIIEYVALRAVYAVLFVVPLNIAVFVAQRMGRLIFIFAKSRRHIAEQNILRAGIASNASDARRIACASFRHFGAMAVEVVKGANFLTHHDIDEYMPMDADPEVMALLRDPSQGVIIVTAHLGNWELLAFPFARLKPIAAVARPMNNPYVNRFLASHSHRKEATIVPKHAGKRSPIVEIVKRGESIGLLFDQHASRNSITIECFGQPIEALTSPARLHLATGAPLVFVACIREGNMRYRIHTSPALRFERTEDRQGDIRRILETINGLLEEKIRHFPEQYLWAHRRWRQPHKNCEKTAANER